MHWRGQVRKDQGMSGEDKRSISRILSRLTEVFERAGIETPRLDAEVLLGFCLGKERADLYRDLSVELDDEQISRVLELTGRRKRREPMAYIRGWREFWSLNFTVTPAVLVPRPETECLVEEVLKPPGFVSGSKAPDPGYRCGLRGRRHCRGIGMARLRISWRRNFRPQPSRWPAKMQGGSSARTTRSPSCRAISTRVSRGSSTSSARTRPTSARPSTRHLPGR